MHKARSFLFVCTGTFLLAPASLTSPPAALASGGYVYLTQWGTVGTGNGQFKGPSGVANDATGNVYVADTNNNRIQKFTTSSVVPSLSACVGLVLSTLLMGAGVVSLRRRSAGRPAERAIGS